MHFMHASVIKLKEPHYIRIICHLWIEQLNEKVHILPSAISS